METRIQKRKEPIAEHGLSNIGSNTEMRSSDGHVDV